MPKRIDRLTPEQQARFEEWADRWIEIGLRTGPADRPRFEDAVRECYRYAGLASPRVIVWVSSPLVLALAAPIASCLLVARAGRGDAVRDVVGDAVEGAVEGAVGGAVRSAVERAVGGAVGGAVRVAVGGAVERAVGDVVEGAVGDAVGDAVGGAVGGAVRSAVGGAVERAVGDAVGDAVRGAVGDVVRQTILNAWYRYIGGQFWVGAGWRYWGAGTSTSFFREVCNLELRGDLWDRALAYEATMESACWWWPHRQFVMVSERPLEIHRELVDQARPRGWGSHRLHCDDRPAAVWPDGWGVWSVHGVRVPRQVVEAPRALTVEQIRDERNAEVRRIMLERFGAEDYLRRCNAQLVNRDDWGSLWRSPMAGDEDLVMVQVTNSTPEPDGSYHDYWLRVPPTMKTARQAVAWSFAKEAKKYDPAIQT